MDVLEEVQPLWTYLRKCNLMDVLEEVKTLMDVLEEVQMDVRHPYRRT